ncbi:hypothetical protein BZA70DRAFT_96228 [Myxozyma melibiosi]|uniref:Zn(2)-C6 fungal-type domain-containing protein n=1 Tax=Myxozyma melibiosi TaxID=54550 RepID=A0ABR1EZ29_9ASCO
MASGVPTGRDTSGNPAITKPTRKRGKYVAAACTECKRRKVKCNGDAICARCTKMNLVCTYKPDGHTAQQSRGSIRQSKHHSHSPLPPTNNTAPPAGQSQLLPGVARIMSQPSQPNESISCDLRPPLESVQSGSVPPLSSIPIQSLTHANHVEFPQSTAPLPHPQLSTGPTSHPPNPPNSSYFPGPFTTKQLPFPVVDPRSSVSSPSESSAATHGYGSLSMLSMESGIEPGSRYSSPGRRSRALPKPARSWEQENQKAFTGPMSAATPFQQASDLLDKRRASVEGKSEEDEEWDDGLSDYDHEDQSSSKSDDGSKPRNKHKRNCRFLYNEHETVKNLIQVYESEINSMSPIFEVNELDTKYEQFRQYFFEHHEEFPDDRDVSVIKLVVATATGVTEKNIKEGRRLYQEVLSMTEWRIVAGTADVYTLISLWLIHNYQFHSGLESLAYRTICFSAVLAVELGLHQSSKMKQIFPDPRQRERCCALFWCIYVVERRLSFSTGRPHVLHEDDIDQKLPMAFENEPGISDDKLVRSLYLNAMVAYTQVAGRVWRASSSFKPPERCDINTEEIDYIEFLISKWYNGLPRQLRLSRPSDPAYLPPPMLSRKLQTILYLRSNLMFLHLYRPVLFSNRTIAKHMQYAFRAVEIALDSIRELYRLHFESDLYSKCQIHYNYFLLTALGVLFTAIIHAPNVFAAHCKREFNMALDLIKLFSKVSSVGKRLWATVKKLRSVSAAIAKTPAVPLENHSAVSVAQDPTQRRPEYHGDRNITSQPVNNEPVPNIAVPQHIHPSPAQPVDSPHRSVSVSATSTPVNYNVNPIGNGDDYMHPRNENRASVENSSNSSIDGQNLSSEVSDLFFMVTGNIQGNGYTPVPPAPMQQYNSAPTSQTYSVPVPAPVVSQSLNTSHGPLPPQYSPTQLQPGLQYPFTDSNAAFTPLGMEAAYVAQMLAQGSRTDSHDDEVFKLIDNLF